MGVRPLRPAPARAGPCSAGLSRACPATCAQSFLIAMRQKRGLTHAHAPISRLLVASGRGFEVCRVFRRKEDHSGALAYDPRRSEPQVRNGGMGWSVGVPVGLHWAHEGVHRRRDSRTVGRCRRSLVASLHPRHRQRLTRSHFPRVIPFQVQPGLLAFSVGQLGVFTEVVLHHCTSVVVKPGVEGADIQRPQNRSNHSTLQNPSPAPPAAAAQKPEGNNAWKCCAPPMGTDG